MSELVVEARELTKVYRKGKTEVTPLKGVDLRVESGEFVALMGPSGSGKTTLLNLIAGVDNATSGTLRVAGTDLLTLRGRPLAAWRTRHIGYIFQLYNLIPVLTAWENVELPLLLLPMSRAERAAQVDRALGLVGLSDRTDHYPRELSGGQEQRVAIARAIATDPTLLVADEPTGDLDGAMAAEILDLMQALNRDLGKAIVMVTHDPEAASRAGRLLRLRDGHVIADEQVPGNAPGAATA
ncbi:MAG: ABC transporter ATP-binding protein [Planctomycetota bacterium]|jgi:putative ABC transport system ATP-binding protein